MQHIIIIIIIIDIDDKKKNPSDVAKDIRYVLSLQLSSDADFFYWIVKFIPRGKEGTFNPNNPTQNTFHKLYSQLHLGLNTSQRTICANYWSHINLSMEGEFVHMTSSENCVVYLDGSSKNGKYLVKFDRRGWGIGYYKFSQGDYFRVGFWDSAPKMHCKIYSLKFNCWFELYPNVNWNSEPENNFILGRPDGHRNDSSCEWLLKYTPTWPLDAGMDNYRNAHHNACTAMGSRKYKGELKYYFFANKQRTAGDSGTNHGYLSTSSKYKYKRFRFHYVMSNGGFGNNILDDTRLQHVNFQTYKKEIDAIENKRIEAKRMAGAYKTKLKINPYVLKTKNAFIKSKL